MPQYLRRQHHVFQSVQVWQQMICLKYESHVLTPKARSPIGCVKPQRFVVQQNPPFSRQI